jgi:hypothetical protein
VKVITPAEDVRRRTRLNGFRSLSLEEQKWSLLDQALRPQKYEWLREKEEAEEAERRALGRGEKKEKTSPALEAYRCVIQS